MVRARSGKSVKHSRRRLRKLTKGYRLSRHNLYKQAVVTLMRARAFAYRDRRTRKRQFRKLWIIRISAACRQRGLRYSQLIRGLLEADVTLNRKMLSEIAIHDPKAFDQIVEIAKTHQPEGLKMGMVR